MLPFRVSLYLRRHAEVSAEVTHMQDYQNKSLMLLNVTTFFQVNPMHPWLGYF